MKLSRSVSYAVQAIFHLDKAPSQAPIPCGRIATDEKLPERFLLQILRKMVNQGILQSCRGVEGGYSMFRSLEEISLLEVIEAVEGPLLANATGSLSIENLLQRNLQNTFATVTSATRKHLETIKLVTLETPDLPRPHFDNDSVAESTSSLAGSFAEAEEQTPVIPLEVNMDEQQANSQINENQ